MLIDAALVTLSMAPLNPLQPRGENEMQKIDIEQRDVDELMEYRFSENSIVSPKTRTICNWEQRLQSQ